MALTDSQAQLFLDPNIGIVATLRRDGSVQQTPVWLDTDGEHVIFNTAEGRAKPKNLRRDPRVSVSVVDRNDPYRWVTVDGHAELSHEGAVEHIDKLSLKYRGREKYGVPEGEVRIVVRVTPERVVSSGA
ncbi:MAG TPA: PPOX class F420-dependent oxidoreductase [Gaiellaceae bacterium]|nr:PPOX class F420-dependent oxidoreductase [Gaiellaceae bacterium]